jgi:hypothetical protein
MDANLKLEGEMLLKASSKIMIIASNNKLVT